VTVRSGGAPAARRRARGRHRGLRAHPQPRPGELLRTARLLLRAERLDAVGPRVRGPARGAAGDRLLPHAARTGRSRVPLIAIRARRRCGAVRLRLELRLLPARLHPAGPGDDDLPAARRSVRRLSEVILIAAMTIGTDTDRAHLERAIELAGRGAGAVKPNPIVGAVIARGEEDLGDATLYVSLEPCCHEGKTPPCTDAILQAGIRRVVVGSDDPTEKASGRGLGILRDEGVEVVLADGDLATRARLLNQAFRKHARVGRPWVLFKSAMTLDGKVATRTGDSQWISGESSRALAHRWRAAVDAVVVGIGTALADDPQLTARPEGELAELSAQPRRVVFDTLARLPPASQLVSAATEIPLMVVVSRAAARSDTDALEAAGAQVLV